MSKGNVTKYSFPITVYWFWFKL